MSSIARKFRRQQTVNTVAKEPPVLIVRPHKPENLTQQQTSAFITRAIIRRIAECQPFPSKAPELARNYAIADFLANYPKKTHIFFLDDDSPPRNPFAIERLLSLNKPVVCGVTPIWRYSKTQESFDLLWSAIVSKEGHTEEAPKLDNIGIDELPKTIFKAYRTGGTCLLIRRDVLEKLTKPYQKTTYNDDVTDVTKSEDIYFCDQIRKAGFDIWVDPETVCSHYHNLDILDVFQVYLTVAKTQERKA